MSKENKNWLHDLFIKEAKAAKDYHNRSSGGSVLPIEVATETEMNALPDTAKGGVVYKYTGANTGVYVSGGLYIVEAGVIKKISIAEFSQLTTPEIETVES